MTGNCESCGTKNVTIISGLCFDCGSRDGANAHLVLPTAEEKKPALPKAAQELLGAASAAGWETAHAWGKDSAHNAMVAVEIRLKGEEGTYHYRITWHTRKTGTLQLFSKICVTPGQYWHDAPSLKAIKASFAVVS